MSQTLLINGQPVSFEVLERKGQSIRFRYNGNVYYFTSQKLGGGGFVLEQETAPGQWQRETVFTSQAGRLGQQVQIGILEAVISEAHAQSAAQSAQARLSPVAPMPGMVRQVLVKAGDKVVSGQALIVVEAMKLQLTLSAGGDATVDAILVKEGQMVGEGAELVKLTAIS
jgi:biotin carboxyl carrier protein